MSRIDSLKEAKRGIGVTCRCGKSARITARGRTLCYECFEEDMGYLLEPIGYEECANGSANLIDCEMLRSECSIDKA